MKKIICFELDSQNNLIVVEKELEFTQYFNGSEWVNKK